MPRGQPAPHALHSGSFSRAGPRGSSVQLAQARQAAAAGTRQRRRRGRQPVRGAAALDVRGRGRRRRGGGRHRCRGRCAGQAVLPQVRRPPRLLQLVWHAEQQRRLGHSSLPGGLKWVLQEAVAAAVQGAALQRSVPCAARPRLLACAWVHKPEVFAPAGPESATSSGERSLVLLRTHITCSPRPAAAPGQAGCRGPAAPNSPRRHPAAPHAERAADPCRCGAASRPRRGGCRCAAGRRHAGTRGVGRRRWRSRSRQRRSCCYRWRLRRHRWSWQRQVVLPVPGPGLRWGAGGLGASLLRGAAPRHTAGGRWWGASSTSG
jgi:hypothetical protein